MSLSNGKFKPLFVYEITVILESSKVNAGIPVGLYHLCNSLLLSEIIIVCSSGKFSYHSYTLS